MQGAVGCLRSLLGGLVFLSGLGALLLGLLMMLGANPGEGAVVFVVGCVVAWLGRKIGGPVERDPYISEEGMRLRQKRERANEIADGIEEYMRRNR